MPRGLVWLPSYYESLSGLPDESRLKLYDAIIRYGIYGEVPELQGYEAAIFGLIKPTIDASTNRYHAAVENGKKGGRPPKENQTKNQRKNQNINQEYDYDSEYDLDSENDSAKVLRNGDSNSFSRGSPEGDAFRSQTNDWYAQRQQIAKRQI